MSYSILVGGDPTVDEAVLFLPPRREKDTDARLWDERFVWEKSAGGVHLTQRVLKRFLAGSVPDADITLFAPRRQVAGKQHELHSLVELKTVPTKNPLGPFLAAPEKGPQHRARVAVFRGYDLRPSRVSKADEVPQDLPDPNLVILNDAGGGLGARSDFFSRLDAAHNPNAMVLHKRHGPLDGKGVTQKLTKSKVWDKAQLVLHLGSDDLRRSNTQMRSKTGWAATVEDLAQAIDPDQPLGRALMTYGTVLVQFGVEGAAVLRSPRKDTVTCTLVYAPAEAEGEADETCPGLNFGVMNAFLCGLAWGVAERRDGASEIKTADVMAALAAARSYTRLPFTVHEDTARSTITLPDPKRVAFQDKALTDLHFELTGVTVDVDLFLCGKTSPAQLARDIVRKGPDVLATYPHVSIGDLIAVTPEEIVAYREIRRVILSYLDIPAPKRPLALAVFGEPGSGKSFGIKQIIKSANVRTMEFNLSESDVEELPGYFQELRDITEDGSVPLCFFDEFDRNKYELVSRFLSPMQDGRFRDKGRTHPLGKSILVFAGGTSATFEAFANGEAVGEDDAQIKALKLPDFASRLDGVLNIKGLNGTTDGSKLRRALILRSVLNQHAATAVLDANGAAMISEPLLDAFLDTVRLRSGARSVEKIVTMSAIRGAGHGFSATDLPSEVMLSPHIEKASDFLEAAKSRGAA